MTTVAEAALVAYSAGLSVVPPAEDGSKRPDTSWKAYQTALPTPTQISAWYGPRAGLGVVCGVVSGGLEMLEFEGRAVAEHVSTDYLAAAEAIGLRPILDRIRTGYQERTPAGGIHLLYRCPEPLPNTKLARRPATDDELLADPADKIKVLIETRGEGGYTILAPSNGKVHPTGGAWTLEAGGFPTIANITVDERDQLFRLARTFDAMPPQAPRKAPAGVDGDRPGDLYDAQPDIHARTLALLETHGWTLVYTRGGIDYLRRPGKDEGVSATLGRAGPGVLHVFSSSTEFETESHKPFRVYAILEHGGDWSAAANALAGHEYVTVTTSTPEPPPRPVDQWPDPPSDAAFHGVLGDITRAVEPHTEADPIGIMATLLTMFGVACGDTRWLYQGAMQPAKIYTVLVGPTAFGGRKGTAYSIAADVVDRAWPIRDLMVPGVASGEGIAAHFVRHPDEPRALALEPEFARLLAIMSREGSTLSAVLRNAWDDVPLGHTRSRDEAQVKRHHLGMLGHITPPELRQRLTSSDAANGFANRILWLAVRRTKLVPRPTSPAQIIAPGVITRLHDAIVAAHRPMEMAFDDEARDRWDWFYAEMAASIRLGLAGAVTARHEAQVARLSLIYALADGADAIGSEHLEAAVAFADYARRSVVWALGDSTGNRHADVLLSMLSEGEIGWEDGKRALGLRTAAEMVEAVAVLTEAGVAEVGTVSSGPGRPRRVIRARETLR